MKYNKYSVFDLEERFENELLNNLGDDDREQMEM